MKVNEILGENIISTTLSNFVSVLFSLPTTYGWTPWLTAQLAAIAIFYASKRTLGSMVRAFVLKKYKDVVPLIQQEYQEMMTKFTHREKQAVETAIKDLEQCLENVNTQSLQRATKTLKLLNDLFNDVQNRK